MRKLVYFIFLIPSLSLAQHIENLFADVQGDRIVISYDLTGGQSGDRYTISLFSSHNGFSSPLSRVTGSVGADISEGRGKQIVWDAKAELGQYKGELSFEVRAAIISPLAFTKTIGSTKRGKLLPLAWRGGNKNQNVRVELLEHGAVAADLGSVANQGTFTWTVPSNQKTGSDFQMRITNGNEAVVTQPFAIKHKVATFVKILPLLGAAAAVIVLGKGGSKPTPVSATLTGPPDLGLN